MANRVDSIALVDLRLRTPWKRGPAAESSGPFAVSYTEFTWKTSLDIPRIYLAAERLRRECAGLDGAVGVALYWQPLRGRGGSVSAWTDEPALRRFVALPYHVEIMRRYRDRGSLRAIDWRADSFLLRDAFAMGQRALDEGQGRQN
jgi:hypothetical protein